MSKSKEATLEKWAETLVALAELAERTVIVETLSGKLKMERSAISMELSAAVNDKK